MESQKSFQEDRDLIRGDAFEMSEVSPPHLKEMGIVDRCAL